MTKITLPAGLLDNSIEIFKTPCKKMMGTFNGTVKSFLDLPSDFIDAVTDRMNAHPSITKALEAAGFITKAEQLEKFAECNFSNFDLTADYADGQLSQSEYHECGFRGACPMEGVVCGFFKVNGEIITPFELEILKYCATEDTLPVIAEKLKVSINNLEEKKKVLFQKFGVLSRPRLVAVGYDLQILNPQLCSTQYH